METGNTEKKKKKTPVGNYEFMVYQSGVVW